MAAWRQPHTPTAPLPRGGGQRWCFHRIRRADSAAGAPAGHPPTHHPRRPCEPIPSSFPCCHGTRLRPHRRGRGSPLGVVRCPCTRIRNRHRQPRPVDPLGQHRARQPRRRGRRSRQQDRQHGARPTKAPTASTTATWSPSASTADRARRRLQEALRRPRQRHRLVRRRLRRQQPLQSEPAAGQHPELHRQQVQQHTPSACTAAAPASCSMPSSSAASTSATCR